MLQPWIKVFQQGYMEAFLINNIVPKLQDALHTFVINPHHQQLGNFNSFKNYHLVNEILKKYIFFRQLELGKCLVRCITITHISGIVRPTLFSKLA